MYCLSMRQFVAILNVQQLFSMSLHRVSQALLAIALAALLVKIALQKYSLRSLFRCSVLLCLGAASVLGSGSKELLLMTLVLIAGQNADLRKVAKYVLGATLTILLVVQASVFLEAIPIMVLESHYGESALRISAGFNHPNSFAAVLMVLLSALYVIRFPRFDLFDALFGIGVITAIAALTESRTFELGACALMASFLVASLTVHRATANKISRFATALVVGVIAASLLAMVLFEASGSLQDHLDQLFSRRLSLANHYYLSSGFTPFGHNFSDGSAAVMMGGVSHPLLLDNAYAYMILVYGVIPGGAMLLLLILSCAKIIQEERISALVICLVTWTLIGVGEAYAVSIGMNFSLLALSWLIHDSSLSAYGACGMALRERNPLSRLV